MLSYPRLAGRTAFPRARGQVVEDSGGFSYLSRDGCWPVTAQTYASDVLRHLVEIGHIRWAAIQDWMCEPFMLARTGLNVLEHQLRTVRSYLDLREIAPDVPWLPIVQGWSADDFARCVDLYDAAGVDLRDA